MYATCLFDFTFSLYICTLQFVNQLKLHHHIFSKYYMNFDSNKKSLVYLVLLLTFDLNFFFFFLKMLKATIIHYNWKHTKSINFWRVPYHPSSLFPILADFLELHRSVWFLGKCSKYRISFIILPNRQHNLFFFFFLLI